MKSISDSPRIYPFKRAVDGLAAKPAFTKKEKGSTAVYRKVLRIVLVSLAAFLLARAGILGGLYPFAPALIAAAAVIYPKKERLSPSRF